MLKGNYMKKYFALLLIAVLLVFTISGCTEKSPDTSGDNNNAPSNNINQMHGDTVDDVTGAVTNDINNAEKLDEDLADSELDGLSDDLKEIDW